MHGCSVVITTWPPLGSERAGTVTVAVPPWAEPVTTPPAEDTVRVTTIVEKPPDPPGGGGKTGAYPLPAGKASVAGMSTPRAAITIDPTNNDRLRRVGRGGFIVDPSTLRSERRIMAMTERIVWARKCGTRYGTPPTGRC